MFRKYLVALAAAIALAMTVPAAAGVIFVPIFLPRAPTLETSPADYKAIHTVAVISGIGGYLDKRYAGWRKNQDISDWNLDSEVETILKTYLGGRFQFQDIAYNRFGFAHLRDDSFDILPKAVPNFLKRLSAPGVDAFIVVHPVSDDTSLHGIAIDTGGDRPTIWANYEIDIYDAHTFERLAFASSRLVLRPGVPPAPAGIIGPLDLATGDDLALTDKQQSLLHTIVSRLVQTSMIETIRALRFGVSLPEPGARTLVSIPPDKLPYKDVKTIAVVSAIGDQIELRKWGAIWARRSYTLPVSGWNIDSTVESDLRAALDKRFTVKDVPVDRAALLDAHLVDDDDKLNPSFPGLAATQDVDAYLVVLKFGPKGSLFSVGDKGLGMLRMAATLGEDKTIVFANYIVALVDAHTLKLIAARTGVQSPDRSSGFPATPVDNDNWPDSPPALTPFQAAKVHASLDDLLSDSIPETLLRLGLTGKMPAEGLPPASSKIASQ